MNNNAMKRIFPLVLICVLSLFLTACSEIQLGSHVYKQFNRPDTSKGAFRVGKPYEIQGKRYYPKETYSYVEAGVASWYGPGFHGKKTANGEQFDQNELTAAHRTLQMPSLVKVTNLDNGRSIVVRVNDRGPFAHGRIMDVSKRAAELLGMIGKGTARVRLELLEDESRALASAARNGKMTKGAEIAYNKYGQLEPRYQLTPSGPVMSDIPQKESDIMQTAQAGSVAGHIHNGQFYPNSDVGRSAPVATKLYVQAGSFGNHGNAVMLSQKLESIAPASIVPTQYGDRMLYKVRLGPMSDVAEADKALAKVLANGQSDAMIVVQ